jgi:hypothetical protein
VAGLERRVAEADAQTRFRSNKNRVKAGRPVASNEQILSEALAEFRKKIDRKIKKAKRTDRA